MANQFVNSLTGPGIRNPEEAVQLLQQTKGKHPGYEIMQQMQEGSVCIHFLTKGGPDIAGAAAISKQGRVELSYSSEGDQYQKEKALALDDGVIIGHRERFVPLDEEPEPWGEWKSVTPQESMYMLQQNSGAMVGASKQSVREDIEMTPDMQRQENGVILDLTGSM